MFAVRLPWKRPQTVPSTTDMARLVSTSPQALAAFAQTYATLSAEEDTSENLFAVNSRQAAAQTTPAKAEYADLIERIVAELLATSDPYALPQPGENPATREEIMALPIDERPQLTGTMVTRETPDNGDAHVLALTMLDQAMSLPPGHERTQRLNLVNGMLDSFDLDLVLYAMIARNPTSMSHWLPPLEVAIEASGSVLRIPATTIVQVPLPILQLTRLDYLGLSATTLEIVDAWARAAFDLNERRDYFIKTGTYSAKFDFRNVHVHDAAEVREIGRYLLYIQHQANRMANPLNRPHPMVGVSTTTEWVVREWIPDRSNSPTIYHGMPLRTEFRVFLDADTDEVLAVAPYWDPAIMLDRFENGSDADDPTMRHDAVMFRVHEPTLTARFEALRDVVEREVAALLPSLDLTGQWSLDVMLNNDDLDHPELWVIDMAPAYRSALSHHVPAGRLRAGEIDWRPQIPEGDTL